MRFRMVLVVLASFVVYVAVLRWIGFSVATFVFLLVLQLALGPKRAGAIAVMVRDRGGVLVRAPTCCSPRPSNVFLPRSRIF